MNSYTEKRLQEIRQTNSYNLSFDSVFSEIFRLFNQSWWQFALVYFLIIILTCGVILSLALTFTAFNLDFDSINVDDIENYSGKIGIFQVFGGTLIAVLLAPFNVGFFKVLQDLKYQGEFRFKNFFYYYSHKSMLRLMTVALVVTLFTNTLNFAFESLKVESPFLTFIPIVISFVVFFYTFFVNPLIIFGDLSVNKAFETSFYLVPLQFMTIFGVVACALLLALSGILLACIGIFFTMSFMYISYFVIYDQVIGTDPRLLEEETTRLEDDFSTSPVEDSTVNTTYEVYTKSDALATPTATQENESTDVQSTSDTDSASNDVKLDDNSAEDSKEKL